MSMLLGDVSSIIGIAQATWTNINKLRTTYKSIDKLQKTVDIVSESYERAIKGFENVKNKVQNVELPYHEKIQVEHHLDVIKQYCSSAKDTLPELSGT